MNINTTPKITSKDAVELAKKYVNAKSYMWEKDTKFLPKSNLVITEIPQDNSSNVKQYALAYKIDIYSLDPYGYRDIYLNAQTGVIIKEVNKIHNGCVSGTVSTLYNGNQTLYSTFQSSSNNYQLLENCNSGTRNIDTRNYLTYFTLTDNDNSWVDNTETRIGGSVHWAMEKVYDYYYSTFGRNSFDNNGATIYSFIHNNSASNVNAFWNGSSFNFGDGDASTLGAVVAIDIVGHEFTHAVTEKTAGLIYSYESGALNESFSDIFGTAIEFNVEGTNGGDYLMGEEIYTSNYFRSMSNPNLKNQPDTYNGTYWYTGSGDNGGVHYNSGVQNYCFYLLSEGGSGVNDKSNSFNVSGIGRNKAAAIFYRALTTYLTSNSQYIDSRNACIRSAQDLYGCGASEVQSVIQAWYAVGVGNSNTINVAVCGDYNNTGTTSYISAYNKITTGNTCGVGYTSINSNANVVLTAYNSIRLSPGFKAKSSSNFRAKIGNCSNPPANLRIEQLVDHQTEVVSPELIRENIIEYNIFPNPSESGIVKVEVKNAIDLEATIDVFDFTGRNVHSSIGNFSNREIDLDLSSLSKGIYIVKVNSSSKQQSTKLVLE
ncbi:MAG: M4 family metallopeptidase [Cytophagales bacterium]|nr:M4 family metallopeptidase [Cytophagales bacterium]